MAKNTENTAASEAPKRDYSERRWMRPTKRAKGYAEERKSKVFKYGDRQGEELDDYRKGLCSGYLLCMSDHAGVYKFKKAIAEGKSAEEAFAISKKKKSN